MMRLLLTLLFLPLYVLSSTQAVLTLGIDPINEIALTPPSFFYIPEEGSTEYKGSYAITTNERNKKITAKLSSPLPEGVELSLELTPPSGAKGTGPFPLSTEETILVVDVSEVAEKDLQALFVVSSKEICFEGNYSIVITLNIVN